MDDDKNENLKQKHSFALIHSDLKSALDQWEHLAEKAPKLSADEKQLQEMQKLLQELKEKMRELGL